MLKLDLGCGNRCKPGFMGVDISENTSATFHTDLSKVPWTVGTYVESMILVRNEALKLLGNYWCFADGCVEEVCCSHFLEHLTGLERMGFMDELWRVMRIGAKATIITPHWSSGRSVMDPTHQWPPLCEISYNYFNREWRRTSALEHYPIKCNFSVKVECTLSESVDADDEASKLFLREHTINTVDDLVATLTKEA